ncbi:scoloptoxin SSD14-like [Tachypleus tridentatus]|uniref:scoloptoxin SSD14-like n=1 Tax=Tachypleus tridentatus TaxID=6853 RepID=UPI003FCF3CC4
MRSLGGLPVAVPGELKVCWLAHQKYGKLNWSDLIQPSAKIRGVITMEDLKSYRAYAKDAVAVPLRGGKTLYTVPLPGYGVLVGFILNVLSGCNFTSKDVADVKSGVLAYHKVMEAFKYAYAKRAFLGNKDFVTVTKVEPDIRYLIFL